MPVYVAPYVDTYAARTPYLTTGEYTNAPTAVDTSQLIPGGTQAANQAELANVIARASSWCDQICGQVLAATASTETARALVRGDGTVRVPARYWPILEVDTFTAGRTPSTMTAVADTADMWIDGLSTIVAPVAGIGAASVYPSYTGGGTLYPGDRAYCQWQYVSGYPNTTLAASVTAGSDTVTVVSALGVYPGSTVTVYDDTGGTEQVTVTVVNANTLTLAAALVDAHAAGVSVSALPPAVKQACISLTSALIKTRGAEALAMPTVGAAPARTTRTSGGGDEDVAVAAAMLRRYRRVL